MVCDIFVIAVLVVYIIWFHSNASSRFEGENDSARSLVVRQAYCLKRDWCQGSLLFGGWHRVAQGASLIFSMMVLINMAYANLVVPVEVTGKIVLYTAGSLIFGVSGAMFKFDVLSGVYRRAYIAVNEAILNYEASGKSEEDRDIRLLCEGISKGERIIGELDRS